MTLDLEGWRKSGGAGERMPVHNIHLHVSEECYLRLEAAEEQLRRDAKMETFLDVSPDELELAVSPDCGSISDCQLRVYFNPQNERCHFHLVGRAPGGDLVYSNAVLVDALM